MDTFNYYSILNLNLDCTENEIKESYKSVMLDIQGNYVLDDSEKEEYCDAVMDSYNVLIDANKRKNYDNELLGFYNSVQRNMDYINRIINGLPSEPSTLMNRFKVKRGKKFLNHLKILLTQNQDLSLVDIVKDDLKNNVTEHRL